MQFRGFTGVADSLIKVHVRTLRSLKMHTLKSRKMQSSRLKGHCHGDFPNFHAVKSNKFCEALSLVHIKMKI